jgi:hypothetical protein
VFYTHAVAQLQVFFAAASTCRRAETTSKNAIKFCITAAYVCFAKMAWGYAVRLNISTLYTVPAKKQQ